MRRVLFLSGVLLVVPLAFGAGWFFGGFTQAHREAKHRYQHDCELAQPLLADPIFSRLHPFDFPANGFCLGGPVATQTDYGKLRTEVTRLFGEPRVGHILTDVWVEAGEMDVRSKANRHHGADER